jgi:hypothetical protein
MSDVRKDMEGSDFSLVKTTAFYSETEETHEEFQ